MCNPTYKCVYVNCKYRTKPYLLVHALRWKGKELHHEVSSHTNWGKDPIWIFFFIGFFYTRYTCPMLDKRTKNITCSVGIHIASLEIQTGYDLWAEA